jgi:hypothetical protein
MHCDAQRSTPQETEVKRYKFGGVLYVADRDVRGLAATLRHVDCLVQDAQLLITDDGDDQRARVRALERLNDARTMLALLALKAAG